MKPTIQSTIICCLLTALAACQSQDPPAMTMIDQPAIPKSVKSQPGSTLSAVRERGYLRCGVSTGIKGFSLPDKSGNWSGLDVDFCKSVAAAIFGNASKVEFLPLTAKERFTALQSAEIDLLSRNSTWTLSRDTQMNLKFVAINFFDGQGFLINKRTFVGATSARDLDGAAVCIKTGTSSESTLADYFRQHGMKYQPVSFNTPDQALKGFEAGRCDVFTSDQSQLYALKYNLKNAEDSVVLPEVISKEPLGPVVREGDEVWLNIVRWSLYALINGEELGLTQKNIDQMKTSQNPAIERFIGNNQDFGIHMGLNSDWAYQIVKEVGNYGEIFDRNLGKSSDLKIDRDLNELWNKGGLLYAPPIQ